MNQDNRFHNQRPEGSVDQFRASRESSQLPHITNFALLNDPKMKEQNKKHTYIYKKRTDQTKLLQLGNSQPHNMKKSKSESFVNKQTETINEDYIPPKQQQSMSLINNFDEIKPKLDNPYNKTQQVNWSNKHSFRFQKRKDENYAPNLEPKQVMLNNRSSSPKLQTNQMDMLTYNPWVKKEKSYNEHVFDSIVQSRFVETDGDILKEFKSRIDFTENIQKQDEDLIYSRKDINDTQENANTNAMSKDKIEPKSFELFKTQKNVSIIKGDKSPLRTIHNQDNKDDQKKLSAYKEIQKEKPFNKYKNARNEVEGWRKEVENRREQIPSSYNGVHWEKIKNMKDKQGLEETQIDYENDFNETA